MHISDFDYDLPPELIAQHPLAARDASRMLVVNRDSKSYADVQFGNLPDYLHEPDILVLNNTRVFPARLRGRRPSGGAIELLLLRELQTNTWEALTRPARRLKEGEHISFEPSDLRAEVVEVRAEGVRVIKFESAGRVDALIDQVGEPPLPPYIKRDPGGTDEDRARYQTVYASQRGAIAAPTAGLHFTPAVLHAIKARGIRIVEITLHVGYGTFEPVRVTDIGKHRVAAERFSISAEVAESINRAHEIGGRVVAVGTTTARALESAATKDRRALAQSGSATLTILPGYRFRLVDVLFTNFHLPKSSLLILVCAFAGKDLMLGAYRHAVAEKYRFYSYGDCTLLT